jgi:hypothetical protein
MDAYTQNILEDSYMETVEEAMGAGHPAEVAHDEGITAAAMMLAAMEGIEDALARSTVASLALNPGMLNEH